MTNGKLTKLIDKHQEKMEDSSRDYIGASSIGSDCLRQIWYQFKGEKAEKVPTKFKRIWAVGKHLEGLIISWLIDAGVYIERNDFTYHALDMPYFQGHFDGILLLRKNRAILEVKTAKDSSFKVFAKKGLMVWNPQYYAQVQAYMGMSGISSAIILVMNKDNCDLFDEEVFFDAVFYESLRVKAELIYNAKSEPPRVHGSPLWYQCKQCKYNKTCHE